MNVGELTIRKLKLFMLIFFLIYLAGCIKYSIAKDIWQSIPLTTVAQERNNIQGGEGFQQILSIVYAPSNPNTVYMGSDAAQIWKSVNGGYSWKLASQGMNANGACSLFVHPNDKNFVLAAGCMGPNKKRAKYTKKRREGIFRSTDGGDTWKFVHKTEFFKQESIGDLFAIDLRSGHKTILYAGSYDESLLMSEDMGLNWNKTNFQEGNVVDIEISYSDPGALFIITSKGLFQYKGDSIVRIGNGLPNVPSNISATPAAPSHLYAVVKGHGVYVSKNNGKKFIKFSHGLPSQYLSNVTDIYASPASSSKLYVGTSKSRIRGPFFTDNGGKEWRSAKTINARGLIDEGGFWFPSPIAPHPIRSDVAIAASNGKTRILRTDDGGSSWYYSGSGFTGARLGDIAFISKDEWYVGLTDHGLWKTIDNGKTFKKVNIPGVNPSSIGAVAVSKDVIIVSIGTWTKKKILISYNKGGSWINKAIYGQLRFIRFHPQKPKIIYASRFRSDDNGKTWKELKYSVEAIFDSDGDIVYGIDKQTSEVLESSDMGNTWRVISKCPGQKIKVNEIAADPKEQGRIYISSNNGLFRIDRKKCVLVQPESGFDVDEHGLLKTRSVAIDPSDSRVVYAGRWGAGRGVSKGIYRSDDYGHTWDNYNNNELERYDVWSIETDSKNNKIVIGTTTGLKIMQYYEE